ncbi:MAG: endonuclease Q family protein, partial [Chloroflexi bacterium]|nr:endonuclease Q family protein [Chloroflexota bacterium]
MLVFAPSLATVQRINSALESKGALHSDGRPSLRATPRELVSILLDIDSRCFVIPAHAWTPWFGIYGSKSGFDSLEECFGDTWEHVPAIETGLSSDPAMNWMVPELDDRAIVSFSDAHSLPRMGRELTYFNGELSYDGLLSSLRTQDIAYTIEFFPEEWKYHHSGHRKCGVSLSPAEVAEGGGRCPKCGRRLTLGVLQRVHELGRREVETRVDEEGFTRSVDGRPPFRSMVALDLIVAESLGVGVKTKMVRTTYGKLIAELGGEMSVLMEATTDDIARVAGDRVAEGVYRVRRGQVQIEPGYDGRYGTVKIWGGKGRGRKASGAKVLH